MAGLGTVINAAAVILGALIGLLLKKAIPEGMKKSIVQALSLATVAIGLIGVVTAACTVKDGAVESRYSLLMVISIAVGTFVGALCDIEARLDRLGEIMQKKFSSGSSMFAEGFVTASLVFCIGSMAILGSLRDGIYHDPTILITKGMIDGVMSVINARSRGGVFRGDGCTLSGNNHSLRVTACAAADGGGHRAAVACGKHSDYRNRAESSVQTEA